ncbi:MAG: hypothetical protein MJA29_10865 [Candidatus Omnitrophica bacterium]|nr:hypothetical protein [Candidatus Omnitrophota bacterium]
MITVDFSLAVGLYIMLLCGGLLVFWLLTRRNRDRELTLDPRYIWHCSICTHTYVNTKEDNISSCPRCGSYNKKNTSMHKTEG